MKHAITFIFIFALVICANFSSDANAENEKQVTFYATYGYRQGDNWVIPMRVWVRQRRDLAEKLITKMAADMENLDPGEIENFRSRIQDFVANSEFHEVVTFVFDHDPENREYRIRNNHGKFPKTDKNGLIQGGIKISTAKAKELLISQGSQDGWLTYHASSIKQKGAGRVRLIEPTGLSVISDIDDTVKITEIPAGTKAVVRNTFFRNFVAAPDMAKMYQGWKGASFHYVSGGPWQMYGPLSEFLFSEKEGFPEGVFHMKNVRKNLLNAITWKDIRELVTHHNLTFEQKVSQISEIMERFPERKFILVGDSGEKDPEVYREIKKRFSNQVREIRIRDVVNDREKNKSRLEGIAIIEAPTVMKRD